MKQIIPFVVIGLVMGFALQAQSQSILVWDRDHDQLFSDPEGTGLVDATYGIRKALNDLGYAYDVTEATNPDLTGYDILFLTMGTYC